MIKIDVEGFEWPVFRGGEETIAKFRPHIIFEYDHKSGSRGGGTPELISEFFRAQRYRLFAIRTEPGPGHRRRIMAAVCRNLGRPSWLSLPPLLGLIDMLVNTAIRYRIRDLLYPGLDLHTRNRASLCCFWQTGPRDVLDAGSGNGYFSWLAYQSGARVVAMNCEQEQVEKARDFLIGHKTGGSVALRFEQRNLYESDPRDSDI